MAYCPRCGYDIKIINCKYFCKNCGNSFDYISTTGRMYLVYENDIKLPNNTTKLEDDHKLLYLIYKNNYDPKSR